MFITSGSGSDVLPPFDQEMRLALDELTTGLTHSSSFTTPDKKLGLISLHYFPRHATVFRTSLFN